MLYLLDTNAVIALLNEPEGLLSQRVRKLKPYEFGLSSIVMHELYFGAYKSRAQARNLAVVDGLRFEVLSFDPEDARHAGEIRAALATQGQPIGGYDVLIAGQALARGLTLVTRNVREFERVAHLNVVNWADA
jgi:tRNA(fMet)-specific endonuclease VapC